MRQLYIIKLNLRRLIIFMLLLMLILAALTIYYISCSNIYKAVDITKLPVYYGEPDIQLFGNGHFGKLAIIIDDFGQDRDGVKEMMSIDRHLTFAIMPFLEYSEKDATTGYERGYEIIVHLAMEPIKGKLSWLGPKPILAGMSGQDVEAIVQDAFDSVPFAVGANNHMGSKASGEETIMEAVLKVVKEKNMYFVDSRTTYHPCAKSLADMMGIDCYERNIFLDGTRSREYIKKQLQRACNIALANGSAIAIGHVGVEGGKATAEAIKEMLPEFERRNVELVFVSELNCQ